MPEADHPVTPQPVEDNTQDADRRGFLGAASTMTMAAGLAAGYGTLGVFAAQYLFPTGSNRRWMFVADTARISPGQSVSFLSPAGLAVSITRKSDSGAEPTADDFVALSSVCPHLGCRVHWEPQNDRFFCPCHNGAFDASGTATAGPPLDAKQVLPRYPLRIEGGLLYIEMEVRAIGQTGEA
jgi:Rieske Fe-S protein